MVLDPEKGDNRIRNCFFLNCDVSISSVFCLRYPRVHHLFSDKEFVIGMSKGWETRLKTLRFAAECCCVWKNGLLV
jgi:hypothetical protein